MIWVQFILCALLVVLVGSRLSFYGDVIAEKSGLGRVWIGAVLIGAATSLPEMATGLSAVVLLKAPNLAVGGIVGSCLFNLVILALADMAFRKRPLLSGVTRGQMLSAALSVVMMGMAAFAIVVSPEVSLPRFLGGELPSWCLLAAYLVGYRMIMVHERGSFQGEENYHHVDTTRASLAFSLLALSIVLLSVWLAYLGKGIARITGWNTNFVGALFLAVVTSLPELVVSYTAVKMGALDLAVGNVFGSNAFNLAILAVYDLAFKGEFWGALSPLHLLGLSMAVVLTGMAFMAMAYSRDGSRVGMGWESPLIVAGYLLATWLLFLLRKG
jgi:cation:H+ antiporter